MADVDSLDENGLQLKSYDVLLEEFQERMREIYGNDINFDSDSPDGQLSNIVAQMGTDVREVLQRIYDSLSLDTATGVNLDRACALIGITRKGGSRTVTPITITTTMACTLVGWNDDASNAYTVQDNAGNRWNLQSTKYFSGADAASLSFQAETIGHQLTTPNTITTPVSLVLGVSSINNPTTATIIGEDEETDFELRSRAKRSIMLASVGFVDSMYAALMGLDGMGSVRILENVTNTTDANGTSPHSIHVITAGSASNTDIAKTILQKRGAGCGMDGNISMTLLNADGYPIDIKWSNVTAQYIFTFTSLSSLDGINYPNYPLIKSQLPSVYAPAVGATVSTNQLITAITSIDSNAFVDSASFSYCKKQKFVYKRVDGQTPGTPTTAKIKITYNGNTSSEIDLTQNLSTVTSAIQSVTGLSNVTVAHTIGSYLAIEFANVSDVLGAITISYFNITDSSSNYYYLEWETQDAVQKISSSGLQYQLALASNRTFLTPIIISPQATTIDAGETKQFSAMGGTGNYRWITNPDDSTKYFDYFAAADDGGFNSDGIFDASSVTGTINDIPVKCIDDLGNYATTTISIAGT